MKNEKGEVRKGAIPKNQRIPLTAANQLCMVYLFLEGKAYNTIKDYVDTPTKRELMKAGVKLNEVKIMEGRAVDARVSKLFVGRVKRRGRYDKESILYDRLPNRTGKILNMREGRKIKLAIKHKRSILIISRLTGRNEEEVQKIVDKLSGKNRELLFD